MKATTNRASENYVPPEDRIATFDQDGTLWVEHPLYTQAFVALDRVHETAPDYPEWKSHEPFKAVLADDLPALAHFSSARAGGPTNHTNELLETDHGKRLDTRAPGIPGGADRTMETMAAVHRAED